MEHENHTLKYMEAYFASKEQKAKDAFWRDVRSRDARNIRYRKYLEKLANDPHHQADLNHWRIANGKKVNESSS